MSDLRRKAVVDLRLVIYEPALGLRNHKLLRGSSFRDKLTVPTLAGINDGSSHRQSSATT